MSRNLHAVHIRDATTADIPALAELHVRTFRETHGNGPDAVLRERQWRDKFARPEQLLFCLLLERADGGIIGFASGEPYDDPTLPTYRGELNKIYLLRQYHRRGLGRLLLCEAARRFLARGIGSMLLFGDARSPTNGFYEAMGGVRITNAKGEFHGAYGWPDLAVLNNR